MSDEKQTSETPEGKQPETTAPEASDLESTIRTAYDRLPSIAKHRQRQRWVALGYIVGIILIVSIGISVLWGTAEHNVQDRQAELMGHLKQRGEQLWQSYSTAAIASAKEVLPDVEKQLMKALGDAQQNLAPALDKATKGMEERLTKKMNKKVEDAQTAAMESQRKKFKTLMPDLFECKKGESDKSCKKKGEMLDLLMLELMKSYRAWAVGELRTTFSGHLKAMDDIRKTMASFTVGRAKRGKSEKGVNMATAPGDMLSL